MKKEIYSFSTQENEFETAYKNIKKLIGHFEEFSGELRAIKKLVDKYTLSEFLSHKGFKNIDSGIVYEYENKNGKILVVLNDFGDKIEDIITHQKTNDIMELALLVSELGFYKENCDD